LELQDAARDDTITNIYFFKSEDKAFFAVVDLLILAIINSLRSCRVARFGCEEVYFKLIKKEYPCLQHPRWGAYLSRFGF
jgi:hypothetical protein